LQAARRAGGGDRGDRPSLYKLTAQGAIPHYKHEGRLAFRRDELDRWLERYAQGDRNWISRGEWS